MPSPEHLDYLTVFSNPRGEVKSLIINPGSFTLDALRTVLWYQATSQDPKDISTAEFSIPHQSLPLTKHLSLKEQYKIIRLWAKIIKNADSVVISSPLRRK
ncbi:MAG: hypothetical protein AAB583_02715 [Patescibacteria group bacterium]